MEKPVPMRSKEEAMDYRYFPDPDLMPIIMMMRYLSIKQFLPELPDTKKERFINEYSIKIDDAEILSSSSKKLYYFEAIIKTATSEIKLLANWILSEVIGFLW